MSKRSPPPITPDEWLHGAFCASAVSQGGVIRHRLADVELYVGWERFLDAVRIRGFRAYRNGDYVLVICNDDALVSLGGGQVRITTKAFDQWPYGMKHLFTQPGSDGDFTEAKRGFGSPSGPEQ